MNFLLLASDIDSSVRHASNASHASDDALQNSVTIGNFLTQVTHAVGSFFMIITILVGIIFITMATQDIAMHRPAGRHFITGIVAFIIAPVMGNGSISKFMNTYKSSVKPAKSSFTWNEQSFLVLAYVIIAILAVWAIWTYFGNFSLTSKYYQFGIISALTIICSGIFTFAILHTPFYYNQINLAFLVPLLAAISGLYLTRINFLHKNAIYGMLLVSAKDIA